jgi:hypothetical protein
MKFTASALFVLAAASAVMALPSQDPTEAALEARAFSGAEENMDEIYARSDESEGLYARGEETDGLYARGEETDGLYARGEDYSEGVYARGEDFYGTLSAREVEEATLAPRFLGIGKVC